MAFIIVSNGARAKFFLFMTSLANLIAKDRISQSEKQNAVQPSLDPIQVSNPDELGLASATQIVVYLTGLMKTSFGSRLHRCGPIADGGA